MTSWNSIGSKLLTWEYKYNPLEEDHPQERVHCLLDLYSPSQWRTPENIKCSGLSGYFYRESRERLLWLELMLLHPEIGPFSLDEIRSLWLEAQVALGNSYASFDAEAIKAKYVKKEYLSKAQRENSRFIKLEKEQAELRARIERLEKLLS